MISRFQLRLYHFFAALFMMTYLICWSEVCGAPSKKTSVQSGFPRLYEQAANPKGPDKEGDEWYPVVELHRPNEDYDYGPEEVSQKNRPGESSSKSSQSASQDKSKSSKTSSSQSEGAGESKGFKTICEDNSKGGKCRPTIEPTLVDNLKLTSKNVASKKQSSVNKGKNDSQSLDQLVQNIGSIVDEQNRLSEKEVSQIRQIIEKMTAKIRELQEMASKCGVSGGTKGSSKQTKVPDVGQPISEIEERHTKERKMIRKKEHDDKRTNAEDSRQQSGNESQVVTLLESEQLVKTGFNATRAQSQQDKNFLDDRPDVNFNGGINRRMNDLKAQWPEGHWPDDDDDNESTETDEASSQTFSGAANDNGADARLTIAGAKSGDKEEDDYYEDDDLEEGLHELTPDYLEEIIREERKDLNKNKTEHHVQEHTLHKYKRRHSR